MNTLEKHKPFWTEEKEQMLVELWAERECMYDVNTRGYTSKTTREEAMKEMVAALSIPGREITRRMASLRTQYSRLLKSFGTATPTKGRTGRQDWVLQSLAFLAPFVKHRPERQSLVYQFQVGDELELEEERTDDDEAEGSKGDENHSEPVEDNLMAKERWVTIAPPRKRRKSRKRQEEHTEEEVILPPSSRTPGLLGDHLLQDDEDGLFCVYVASEMRKISDERIKLQLKSKIQGDLVNARIQSLNPANETENNIEVT